MVLSSVGEVAMKWALPSTVNGYDIYGGQVSNLDKSLLDGHELTPESSF